MPGLCNPELRLIGGLILYSAQLLDDRINFVDYKILHLKDLKRNFFLFHKKLILGQNEGLIAIIWPKKVSKLPKMRKKGPKKAKIRPHCPK